MYLRETPEALIRPNKSVGVKRSTVCKLDMTCNLGAIKAISPSVLTRCCGEDLFYGCNFALMFPLPTLNCCVALHRVSRGPLIIDSLCQSLVYYVLLYSGMDCEISESVFSQNKLQLAFLFVD